MLKTKFNNSSIGLKDTALEFINIHLLFEHIAVQAQNSVIKITVKSKLGNQTLSSLTIKP